MDLNIGIKGQEEKLSNLRRLAYTCSLTRAQNLCGLDCTSCALNVDKFIADPAEAALIKTTAELDRRDMVEYKEKQSATGLGFGVIIVAVIFMLMMCGVAQNTNADGTRGSMTLRDIPTYLMAMKSQLRDVDGDGVIDCLDKAVVFYEVYPGYSEIWVNYNPNTGMNHAINRIMLFSGEYVFVDSSTTDIERWHPWQVWGNKYDAKYNRDATYLYSEYARW
jgi:hypothetical protein